MEGRPTEVFVSEILNCGWWVRHYRRGARASFQKLERDQAIQRLGLTVREAFNESEDFEALLTAVLDALQDKPPPF